MRIEYPGPGEKEAAIARICESGVIKKESLYLFIRNMISQLGVKNIFYGIYDAMVLSVFIFVLFCAAVFTGVPTREIDTDKLIALTFAASPMMYFTIFSLSYLKERSSDTFSVKMTCRYTARHLLAFRMLAFSLLSFVFNWAYIAAVCLKTKIDFFLLSGLSFSSLSVFSCALMICVLKWNTVKAIALLSAAWIFGNMLLWKLCLPVYAAVLKAIPIASYMITACIFAALYLRGASSLAQNKRKAGSVNA